MKRNKLTPFPKVLAPFEPLYFQVFSQEPIADKELMNLAEMFKVEPLRKFAVQELGFKEHQLDTLNNLDIFIKWRNMNSSEGNARKVCTVHLLAIICLLFEGLNIFTMIVYMIFSVAETSWQA